MKSIKEFAESFARMPGTKKWPWIVAVSCVTNTRANSTRPITRIITPIQLSWEDKVGPILTMVHEEDPNFFWSVDQVLKRTGIYISAGVFFIRPEYMGGVYALYEMSGSDDIQSLNDDLFALNQLGIRAHGLDEYANWTAEEREPYLEAWNKAMEV